MAPTRWVKFGKLFNDMHVELYRVTTDPTLANRSRDFRSDLEDARAAWLWEFEQLNERLPERDWSRTDTLFIYLCYEQILSDPLRLLRKAALGDVLELSARVCILGCRHTPKSRSQDLSEDAIRDVFVSVASWAVQFGSYSYQELMVDLETVFPHPPSGAICEALHELMDVGHLVHLFSKVELAQRRERQDLERQERIRKIRKESNLPSLDETDPDDLEEVEELYQEEEDIEESSARGDYWLVDLQICLVGLIPTASRVFRDLTIQQHVLRDFKFATEEEHQRMEYLPSARKNLMQQVAKKCQEVAGGTFRNRFREFVYYWMLPLGSIEQIVRAEGDTANRNKQSSQVVIQELGVEVTEALSKLLDDKLSIIIANPQHELHQLLILFASAQLIQSETSVSFLQECVVQPHELAHRFKEVRATEVKLRPRQPFLLFPLQQTVIQSQGRLYQCKAGDSLDAVLRYLSICANDRCVDRKGVSHESDTLCFDGRHGASGHKFTRYANTILGDSTPGLTMEWEF